MTSDELEVWLAERAMGWKRAGNLLDMAEGKFYVDKTYGVTIRSDSQHPPLRVWCPTNSKADAMQLLEKCAESTAFPILIGVMAGGWYCEIGTTTLAGTPPNIHQWTTHKTLPPAISRFAFVLFGGDTKKS